MYTTIISFSNLISKTVLLTVPCKNQIVNPADLSQEWGKTCFTSSGQKCRVCILILTCNVRKAFLFVCGINGSTVLSTVQTNGTTLFTYKTHTKCCLIYTLMPSILNAYCTYIVCISYVQYVIVYWMYVQYTIHCTANIRWYIYRWYEESNLISSFILFVCHQYNAENMNMINSTFFWLHLFCFVSISSIFISRWTCLIIYVCNWW